MFGPQKNKNKTKKNQQQQLTFFISHITNTLEEKVVGGKAINVRQSDKRGKAVLKLLRQCSVTAHPHGLEAGDFMDASL